MTTFIRAVEFWLPSRDRLLLEHGGGWYGRAAGFGEASRALCFGRGEGLPGQAWEQAQPIVLTGLEGRPGGSSFVRSAAAKAAGLTAAIALPCFAGDFLTAVTVFFCGNDDMHAGAIELWQHDAAASPDMSLVDGHYSRAAEAFASIARQTRFHRGSGLPGLVWQGGLPVFIEDLGRSKRFLRADSGTEVGIHRGFALPCATPRESRTCVLAFLSALDTPIARRYEWWLPDAGGEHLRRDGGHCEFAGNLARMPEAAVTARGQGTIGLVMVTGIPGLGTDATGEPAGIGREAAAAGLTTLVAMPLMRDGRLRAVVAWYF